jgi:hypothetical protein
MPMTLDDMNNNKIVYIAAMHRTDKRIDLNVLGIDESSTKNV